MNKELNTTEQQCNKQNVKHSCYDCANMMSSESGCVCWVWCSKTDRDYTFGGENTEICEHFEED